MAKEYLENRIKPPIPKWAIYGAQALKTTTQLAYLGGTAFPVVKYAVEHQDKITRLQEAMAMPLFMGWFTGFCMLSLGYDKLARKVIGRYFHIPKERNPEMLNNELPYLNINNHEHYNKFTSFDFGRW